MSLEDIIARAVNEAVERQLREQAPAIADLVAARLAKGSSELASVEDAASQLSIGAATIRTLIKQRRVRAYRTPGGAKREGRIRVDVAEVRRAMTPTGAPVPEGDINKQASDIARKLSGG
jgi:excisionase family DNA binding protein